ncbi:putative transmembrane protein [Toxoplasma gondii p89]|uniref:Putative transmembrane protein n=1 Tax=Toxoplasma gondii p89 TaxID=943119 RepID=A0A086JMM1_TOXGO|nr:putative transmembrane protein [Toxoplasma gondii p89]
MGLSPAFAATAGCRLASPVANSSRFLSLLRLSRPRLNAAAPAVEAAKTLERNVPMKEILQPLWVVEPPNFLRQPVWKQFWEAQFANRSFFFFGNAWTSAAAFAFFIWWSRVFGRRACSQRNSRERRRKDKNRDDTKKKKKETERRAAEEERTTYREGGEEETHPQRRDSIATG